jgi:hypothetical protein
LGLLVDCQGEIRERLVRGSPLVLALTRSGYDPA